MWVSVLLLALAVNLEPTRICLVPLLLARDRPRRQLIAFLAGNLTMSLGFGLLALFYLVLPIGLLLAALTTTVWMVNWVLCCTSSKRTNPHPSRSTSLTNRHKVIFYI